MLLLKREEINHALTIDHRSSESGTGLRAPGHDANREYSGDRISASEVMQAMDLGDLATRQAGLCTSLIGGLFRAYAKLPRYYGWRD